jgi:hypothetical protein
MSIQGHELHQSYITDFDHLILRLMSEAEHQHTLCNLHNVPVNRGAAIKLEMLCSIEVAVRLSLLARSYGRLSWLAFSLIAEL